MIYLLAVTTSLAQLKIRN